MKVLSLHLGHNSTVALSLNGDIKGVLSQEKCDNIKNSFGFPIDAVNALVKEIDWDIDSIDYVLVSSKEVFPPRSYNYLISGSNVIQANRFISLTKKLSEGVLGSLFPFIFDILSNIRVFFLKKEGLAYLKQELSKCGLSNKPLHFIDHHLCHARASFNGLKKRNTSHKPALIFTMDGSGDGVSATVSMVDSNGKWSRLAFTPAKHSLGGIYSNTTRFLGMKILEHEYKVMGLAPYAKEEYMLETYEKIFKPVIQLNPENKLIFKCKYDTSKFYNYLAKNAVGERFDNLAAALQHLTEVLVIEWIKYAIVQTGIKNIYTGGGVFMNVKLNRRIQEIKEVENVSFMPSCGDESLPIGACYEFAESKGLKTSNLKNLYLGLSYSNQDIEKFIKTKDLKKKYNVKYFDDIEYKIASLLADKQIIARFAGRCEWGARSLGNRAILAHPSYMESFYTVNDYIKCRDFWMPFAPSMLDTAADKYLINYEPNKATSPYMITAYAATNIGLKHLRAAIHQGDHTLRPQVVEMESSPKYYRIIKEFENKTGVGAILNTSFNLHGYPLVANPEQAVFTFENSELKFLALENYILEKRIK